MIIFHDPRCGEYSRQGHVERPARIARTVPLLKERHSAWEWRLPGVPNEAALELNPFCASPKRPPHWPGTNNKLLR